jgi:CHAD domain-containing protein
LTAAQLGLTLLPYTAEPDEGFSAHLLATLDAQLRILLTEQRSAGDPEQPEAVHQMRIATRRLRVALRTAEAGLAEPERAELEALRTELAWLNGLLGPVRDLDVLGERLRREGENLPEIDRPGFTEINTTVERERAAARETLTAELAGRRYRALLRSLAGQVRRLAEMPGAVPESAASATGSTPPATESTTLVRRPIRKIRKEITGLTEPPTATELHQVRIRAKRVRYAAEQAASLAGKNKRLNKLANAAKRVQNVLGEHHDTVAAEQRLREIAHLLSPEGLLVAGRLVERERGLRADREATWWRLWHKLDRRARAVVD